MGFLHQISLLRAQETFQNRRRKECKNQRRQKTPVQQGLLNQLTKVHMFLQDQHRSASGLLYGCVCIIYNSFQFNIFRGLLNVYSSGYLILGTSLGALSVCLLICLVQILCDTFYCILFFLYSIVISLKPIIF